MPDSAKNVWKKDSFGPQKLFWHPYKNFSPAPTSSILIAIILIVTSVDHFSRGEWR